MGDDFVFQQDGALAHRAKVTWEQLVEHCPDFTDKDSMTANSLDLNALDYHVWESCCKSSTT